MSEQVAELESSPQPVRARRRIGGLVLVVANFALLTAALVASLLVTSRFAEPATVSFDREGDAVTLPDFGERGAHVVDYRHGETVTFSLAVRSGGPVSMRLTGVRLSDDDLPLLRIESASVEGDPLPVTLGAGKDARLTVTARYDNCRYYHERELQHVEEVTIATAVLGLGLTRRVSLDHDLVIRSPMIVDCPDRTLQRGDDARPRR